MVEIRAPPPIGPFLSSFLYVGITILSTYGASRQFATGLSTAPHCRHLPPLHLVDLPRLQPPARCIAVCRQFQERPSVEILAAEAAAQAYIDIGCIRLMVHASTPSLLSITQNSELAFTI